MISSKIRSLREEERQDAYEVARRWTAGKMPEKKDFKVYKASKYPQWVLGLVSGLCLVLLVAAFIPSAFRLFSSGRAEFCQSISDVYVVRDQSPDLSSCDLVGYSTIVLAETGSLVFLLALAVIKTSHRVSLGRHQVDLVPVLLWGGAILSTTIAIIGNAHIGRPWEYGHHAFDYLITFGPPLLVMGVGYVLKDILLLSIESRYESERLYLEALEAYHHTYGEPESSPKWLRFYSRSLREALQKANRRVPEALEALESSDWEALVRRELRADDWMVTPSTREEDVEAFQTGQKESVVEKGEIWKNPNGTWTAKSHILNTVIGTKYKSEGFARLALTNKHRSLQRKVTQNGHVETP